VDTNNYSCPRIKFIIQKAETTLHQHYKIINVRPVNTEEMSTMLLDIYQVPQYNKYHTSPKYYQNYKLDYQHSTLLEIEVDERNIKLRKKERNIQNYDFN
jgi:hypothetical protein